MFLIKYYKGIWIFKKWCAWINQLALQHKNCRFWFHGDFNSFSVVSRITNELDEFQLKKCWCEYFCDRNSKFLIVFAVSLLGRCWLCEGPPTRGSETAAAGLRAGKERQPSLLSRHPWAAHSDCGPGHGGKVLCLPWWSRWAGKSVCFRLILSLCFGWLETVNKAEFLIFVFRHNMFDRLVVRPWTDCGKCWRLSRRSLWQGRQRCGLVAWSQALPAEGAQEDQESRWVCLLLQA